MKKLICSFLFVLISLCAFAEKTPVKSLYSYKLENGLSLFVVENHAVPLTYIEITVRCGGYTQTPENVGIFHLYEHMMFKGNSLYKSAAELDRVTSDMGVSDRNGTTDIERVNYFFTVPSELTEKGLEFWNAAIRFPNLDKKELENEKKVVISEINGKNGDPQYKVYKALINAMFPENQHTVDSAGTEEFIKKATVKQLKEIQKNFYIPNNSALFVAGDVNPDEVYEMAKKIFGSWKKGRDPFAKGIVRHTQTPFSAPELYVQPLDTISKDIACVDVEFRGPDAAYNQNDTYAADFMLSVLNQPEGRFMNSLINDGGIGVPSSDYIGTGYYTRKTCSTMNFSVIIVSPEEDLPERAQYFASVLPDAVKDAVENLSSAEIKKIGQMVEDSAVIQRQTAASLAEILRVWWTVADENYYYTYNEKLRSVSVQELSDFVDRYISGRQPLICVLVNPEVFEETRSSFEKAGFKLCFEDKKN